MKQEIMPIINPSDLIHLAQSRELIIVDARSGVKNARADYLASHLEAALFVDMDTDLADIKADVSNGGRHPLPDAAQFSTVLTKLGITPSSYVIVYDDKNAANAAARFWWMLKSVGHKKVQVVDGGLKAAVDAGFPVSSGEVKPGVSEPYGTVEWLLPLTDMEAVEKAAGSEGFIVIDVRSEECYNGDYEPIDIIAGHIPGAVNIPFTENLDADGFFLSPEILHEKYATVLGDKTPTHIIVHCGSGVTACHTMLAMAYAGLAIPTLYVGSWSEWCRNDKPIATRDRV